MADDFLDPMLERIDRAQQAGMRIGKVTAIDSVDASLTVSMAGDIITGVRWVGSYAPVVADLVVVSRVDAMWVVLGKLSKQLGAPTVIYGSYSVLPSSSWQWRFDTGWAIPNDYVEQDGSSATARRAGLFIYAPLSIPAGATITSAKLTLERGHPIYDAGAPLVSPTIYGSASAWGATPAGAPVLVGGYGPWRPGTLTFEQQGVWDLPSTWLTAMLAGTLTGFNFYTTSTAEDMTVKTGYGAGLSGSLQINFTKPA